MMRKIIISVSLGWYCLCGSAWAEDNLYQQGLELLNQGKYQKAVELLERSTRLKPEDLPSLQALGKAYLKLNQLQLAAATLEQARAIDRDSAETHFLLGLLRYEEVDYTRAISEFRTVIYLKRLDPEIYYHLARALFALKENEQAQQALQQALDKESLSNELKSRIFLLQATHESSPEKALTVIQQALQIVSEESTIQEDTYVKLAQLYHQLDRIEEQIDTYFKLLERTAEKPDAQEKYYALMWRELGSQTPNYLQYLIHKIEHLQELFPNNQLTRQQLLQIYKKNNQWEKIIAFYQRDLIDKSSKMSDVEQSNTFYQIAEAQLQLGYFQFAYDNYERAYKQNNQNINALVKMGLLLMSSKEYSAATKKFEEALKQRQLDEDIKLYLAFAYLFDNQPDQAAKFLSYLEGKEKQEQKRWLSTFILYKKGQAMPELWRLLTAD